MSKEKKLRRWTEEEIDVLTAPAVDMMNGGMM